MDGKSVNFFEYSIMKNNKSGIKFFSFIYKVIVILFTVCLFIALLSVSDKYAKEAYLPILFSSPVLGLFFALGIIYFVNGNFHISYEYEISEGKLKITEFKGKHFFGFTYKKILIDCKISEIDTIDYFEKSEPEERAAALFAVSGVNGRRQCFATFKENGINKTIVFETTDKMKSLLVFYNGEKAFSRE